VESARTTARMLLAQGADIVIAITHSRFANDLVLTEAVPEITILLGGHDHFFKDDLEHRVIKSGEEWRWMSKIRIDIPAGSTKPVVTYERQEITSDLPEDVQIDALCDKYHALQQKKFLNVICTSAIELHPEEEYVRFKESAICNWVCDVCCEDYSLVEGKQTADICYLQGFYFAGKAAIPAGDFTLGNLMGTFPKSNLLCVIELTGEQVVGILNRSVASLPGECGSIGHVNSAVKYTIVLPSAENGADKATVRDVLFEGEPIDLKRVFRVATAAATIATGPKYGYIELADPKTIVQEEFASQLADVVIMHCNHNKNSVINPTTGRITIV
jgi:5'-nucleotidase